jgi:hypothetical protein
MKRAEVIGTVTFFLFLAVSAPVWAQQGQQSRGQQHEQHAKSAGHGQQHAQRAAHGRQARAPQQHARGARAAGHVRQARPTRVAQRRGGYHGRIPAARFRANFGAAHRFRINRVMVVGGHRRFYYGGYWFAIPGPWPAGWAYTNSFYINYINGGYYLCNPQYPGTTIAISIVL